MYTKLILFATLSALVSLPVWGGDRYAYRHNNYNVEKVKVIQKEIEFNADYFDPEYGYYLNEVPNLVQAKKDYESAKTAEKLDLLINLLLQQQKGGALVTDKPSLDDQVLKIFKDNKCGTCHGTSAQGGVQLVDKDGKLVEQDLPMRVLIHNITYGVGLEEQNKKLMPLNGEPLSDENVETLRKWMLEKAEQERT